MLPGYVRGPPAPRTARSTRRRRPGSTRQKAIPSRQIRRRHCLVPQQIVPAHSLRTASSRMAVHQRQPAPLAAASDMARSRKSARSSRYRGRCALRPEEISSRSRSAVVRVSPLLTAPETEANVFLPVGPQQMLARLPIHIGRHSDAALRAAHCESQSRQTWLI